MKIQLMTELAKIQEMLSEIDCDLWREDFRGWRYEEDCNCKRCRWIRQ